MAEENLLVNLIETAMSALNFIDEQTDGLLESLPDETTGPGTDGEKYLNRIYGAISDTRAIMRGAYALAADDIQNQLGYAAASCSHLEQLRADAWRDRN